MKLEREQLPKNNFLLKIDNNNNNILIEKTAEQWKSIILKVVQSINCQRCIMQTADWPSR